MTYYNTIAKSANVEEVNAKCGGMTQPTLSRLEDRMKAFGQFSNFVMPSTHSIGHNVWILKCTGFNRGIGIPVFSKIEELKKLMEEYTSSLPMTD